MDNHEKNQNYYALTFVSVDSQGLVAQVAKIFFDNGFNIADSSSILLQGVFSMIFIVTSSKNYTENEVLEMFKNSKIVPHVFKYKEMPHEEEGVHYSVSIYGADRPGIVAETAACLAKNGVNIIDLQTKITGKQTTKIYIMIFEVTIKEKDDNTKWQNELIETAKKMETEVNIKKIEFYEL